MAPVRCYPPTPPLKRYPEISGRRYVEGHPMDMEVVLTNALRIEVNSNSKSWAMR